MPSSSQIARSKAIQQRTGRTFHLATRLLPARVRDGTYVLYGFFRIADDIVDTTEAVDPAAQQARLDSVREQALGTVPPADPVLAAFNELRAEYDIPDREVELFIDAMRSDIEHDPMAEYADLETYMRGSAVAVANMMLEIMEPEQPELARPHAAALAEAFQLTNFLRDVREDIRNYDRVYLPAETRERFGVTVDQLAAGDVDAAFEAAMKTELARTEALYHEGVDGIRYLPADCQFGVLLAAVLYAEYHRVIRRQNYDVLSARPSIPSWRKLYLLAKTRLYWHIERDPAVVFRRVSAIEERGEVSMNRDVPNGPIESSTH